MDTGLYIVTLNNIEPISVNADRLKVAEKCIKVNHQNCKLGRAKTFAGRKREYERTFGKANVNFWPVIAVDDFQAAEKLILPELNAYRIRGKSGRRNEWLQGIDPIAVLRIVVSVMDSSQITHQVLVRPSMRK